MGTPLCFTKFLVSKKFMDKRGGGGGEVSRYSVKNFLSHSAESFIGEPFSVSLISGIEKFNASESYITLLCRIFFCLTVPKNFLEEPF